MLCEAVLKSKRTYLPNLVVFPFPEYTNFSIFSLGLLTMVCLWQWFEIWLLLTNMFKTSRGTGYDLSNSIFSPDGRNFQVSPIR